MNNIDITKIAVKFDVENTTEELFNDVVNKFIELGYRGSLEYVDLLDVTFWNTFALQDNCLLQVKSSWLKLPQYTVLSPQEFLALGNKLEHIISGVPVVTLPDNTTIVAEWLHKLQHVFAKDHTIKCMDFVTMIVETDHGDVRGAKEIVKFVDNRYNQLTSEHKLKVKQELEAKRQKLMDELSEIDQQLGLYN